MHSFSVRYTTQVFVFEKNTHCGGVVGCGIGVLLRMIWVMGIVMYRFVRGTKGRDIDENDFVYDVVVFDPDAESIVLPPPEYTDEKVALVVTEQDVKA